ncbi:hydroxysqualene dehydroxylase HpnE [Acidihalobacter aeolianus]|uniref:hydroxysqualene dehydroxylase HpnE n=1 Tax=Acidihalobacter aeolianus TaxID=2792603 RepID=UPI0018D30C80|nr:hydroxysqualene dehydroxylase HpnE [Acidihalobacter aeolianus]
MKPVVVVGAGWAGLSAALHLISAGIPVVLLEAASVAGGRARDLPAQPHRDNGQHLLIGAYCETLALLQRLGVQRAEAFHETPLDLFMRPSPDGAPVRLRGGQLPGKLHLLQALAGARGIDWSTRLALLRSARLLRGIPPVHATAREWLLGCGQNETAISLIWAPLCLAALNLPVEAASARVLQRTLAEAFADADCAKLLIPKQPLGALLPRPALHELARRGADIRLNSRVSELIATDDRITRVRLRGNNCMDADHVVLAVSPAAAARLLQCLPATRELAQDITALGRSPIVTAYLEYTPSARLDPPLQALLNPPATWLFDRRIAGEPGIIAAVLSGPGPDTELMKEFLAERITAQIGCHFPNWGKPRQVQIIRERAATFLATPDNETRRPSSQTPLAGLWLAGDYTATGLPATLEGAVRSGLECATKIIRRLD